jgi:23S rRNA pseudouridine1911/1915/1917 synthase
VADERELVAESDGERLDVFIARLLPELTRSRVRKLIDAGCVAVDGRRATKAGQALDAGARVRVTLPPEDSAPEAESIPLRIVYEDGDLLVVDKPAGLAVHPSPGHERHTLVNAVLAHCPELSGAGGEGRPGIVHRLDKDTSGLIIVAKNDETHLALAKQLKEREVGKVYVALVEGVPAQAEGVIDAPLGRHPVQRKRQAVVTGGREARTHYRVVREVDGYALLEVRPETGRTHQIRVHLAAIGHPVAGDALYGRRSRSDRLKPVPRNSRVPRQFLHAAKLSFRHPRTGARLDLEAPLADDLARALAALGKRTAG